MWDEIWTEVKDAGEIKGTLSKKDDSGVTRTVTMEDGPAGSVRDESLWLDAAKAGGKIAESGKTDSGVKASIASTKALSSKQTVKAVSKLFGITAKPKAKPKPKDGEEGTVSEDDTALEGVKS